MGELEDKYVSICRLKTTKRPQSSYWL